MFSAKGVWVLAEHEQERMHLIMSGGVIQKQSDLLQGDPEYIALNIVRFLSERKLLPC